MNYFATMRGDFLQRLRAVALMTSDIFVAFTEAGFQRDEALALTMQFIDRIDVDDVD
jgi:hypothetical protein